MRVRGLPRNCDRAARNAERGTTPGSCRNPHRERLYCLAPSECRGDDSVAFRRRLLGTCKLAFTLRPTGPVRASPRIRAGLKTISLPGHQRFQPCVFRMLLASLQFLTSLGCSSGLQRSTRTLITVHRLTIRKQGGRRFPRQLKTDCPLAA
jgi:hypothetical protein